ncbi:glyoxalase-like domain protein [Halobacteriovorax sp. BALOs_7]|uniref:Glyoxalase n=1 Tax=Halobacteriovorax vibrionivorans TaxID=2152716 RepID=A0ABY0IIK0_9BACT|nr:MULTISPECIES: VOC family protein [Halobacteriovorax]AYF45745.1 glyoxalase-like domain protein [Halobacteriovorax sp. BALOs_7]RZF22784.1 glyoxalase [Halobacteriovorax vibrionivorans]TGD45975.1 glyoxalase [Halobacteriovorax sp. Y22]
MNLSAIGIACESLEDSIKFYENFGLNFTQIGDEHYEATTKSGLRLMLDSYDLMKKINPSWERPIFPGITLCFEQDNPQSVDNLVNKLKDKDVIIEKEPWDAFWGQRYASVKDPDGNQIDIFALL